MSTLIVRRPARRPGPELPSGELALQEPPVLPEQQGGMGAVFMYLPMALSSLAMVMLFLRPGSGGGLGGAMPYVAGGMMLVGAVAMLGGQYLRTRLERRRALAGERRDYLRYLGRMRGRVRELVAAQRDARAWNGPDPEALWSLVRTTRLWERRAAHGDFGEVRFAVGRQPLNASIAPLSTKPVEDLEPLSAHALRRFIAAYSTVADLPVSIHLRGYAHIALRGDAEAARAMARAVVGQLAVFHAPDELRIAACVGDDRTARWEWLKWLPHCLHPAERDGAGPVRLIAPDAVELERLIGPDLSDRPRFDPQAAPGREEPFTVVLVDGGRVPQGARMAGGGYRNAVVVEVGAERPWDGAPHTLSLRVGRDEVEVADLDRSGREVFAPLGRPDRLGEPRARALARLLAPYRMSVSADVVEPLTTDFDLTTLLGIANLHTWDPHRQWERGERPEHRLRVPVGMTESGAPLELDLKESALGGMGPHGMLIGATGSGKSELLRTLVLALALTHSSETLNFVLVDFKGGATFIGLDRLSHTSALITNLADETSLVERMQDALHGELIRRQERLRAAGNFSSVHEYEKARRSDPGMEPMPTLLVVVDEFSELLAAHRDFMDLFVMIGRLGRSLGVHLLLASQRLDEGRMHQLESHLSYRIALRTFSAMESRGVLGVPDAHQLPPAPGNGYLKIDTDELARFKAAYVSGPYRARRRPVRTAAAGGEVAPLLAAYVAASAPAAAPEPEEPEEEPAESLLETALEAVRGAGPPARRVWLPPLDAPPALGHLLAAAGLGGRGPSWSREPVLSVPLGEVDRPFEQLRTPLTADLRGAGGHTAVVGGPQSGKSTLLLTLISALALTNTPAQAQFYILDFGGGTLRAAADLPHVGGVCGRLDSERINRTVAEMTALLGRRERVFAEHGVDSMADYRRRRARGEFADERYGDVFLVIDGWATVRQDMMDLIPDIVQIAQRGLSYGVHLVVASPRWADVQSSLRDLLGTRFELRLGDAVDSAINMRKAETVPRVPGRGLTDELKHFLTAVPRLADGADDRPGGAAAGDGGTGTAEAPVASGLEGLVRAVADAWDGPPAPPVRTLPLHLPAAGMPAVEEGPRVPLGLEERRLEPFWHDFATSPHMLAVGDTESGKTNLLRLVTRAIRERYTAEEARVVVVDPRRGLFDAIPEEQRLGYAVTGASAQEMMNAAAQALKPRLPGPEVTPEELRARSWWTGPELFVVIDDYDLLGTGGPGPLAPLLDMLPLGADIGLHLILARGAGGFSRAMGEPALRMLIDANTPSIVLSCPPSEGVLFGSLRPRTLPPGRALRLDRRDPVQVHLALDPETEEAARR
ncbi:type VII secretion protein EccC [Nocardiopsis baichengensis]|uniref:type VII secretion protein EccC n=1 Tax=Nocardiopsis baichengensis TaxID=280240 RepID=UPI00037AA7A7|nr:type VII secretion protein EccC [Nocardiopsis baichengensis]